MWEGKTSIPKDPEVGTRYFKILTGAGYIYTTLHASVDLLWLLVPKLLYVTRGGV